MTKPPDRDSARLRAFLLSVGVFLAVGSVLAQAAPAGSFCMVQKQKVAASLQRPNARRSDASRISKQRVTAACSVLWRIKYLLLPVHLEDSTTPSSLPGSPFGTAPPPGTS